MDIKELNSFKLSDAIKFHDKLNPRLWRGDRLDPAVKKQLLLIAEDFIEELGLASLDVEDITVSGSNAAFTYTPHSDLDLHILVDMSKLPSNEVYRELFQAKKTLYNDSHNITIHGVPIELYVQDTNEPVVSLGEYSILNDKWIKRPTKRRANLDQNLTREKFDRLKELVLLALATRNLDRVNRTLKTIKRYRKAGLDKGGEFSPENLAFKAIRKQGGIQKLYDLRNKLHSETLTIENMYVNPPKDDLAERLSKEFEDYHPNAKPRGPEFPPTMPAGTVRVDVSDVYDWYKLGQHISNMKGLGKHDFGKGPPSTVLSFGDEETEHKYIQDLEKTGLTTTDIDPIDPKQPKGMKRQKTDPAYNVNESSDSTVTVYHGNQGGIDEKKLYMPMWFSTNYNSVLEYTGDDGFVLAAELTPKKTLVIDGKPGLGREINTAKENWRQLLSQGYDSIVQDYGKMQDWVVLDSSIIHIAEKLSIDESSEEFGGIQMHFEDDEDEIFVQALAGQKKLGHVLFVKQSNNILLPQDLEVDERFRGQGIASTMYDYVKSKGYKIRRSGQQTIAGAGFWGKHRSGQNVWEASEYVPSAKEITETTFAGKDPMSFKSPNGGTPIMLLVTGQGSRYLMTSDGMVLRNKSFHASTGGEDQGMKDWSGAIEFYEPNEKPGGVPFALSVGKAVEKKLPVALSNTKDGKRALMIYDGKQWRVAKISDIYKNVASTDAPIVATYSKSPKLNWNVLDYDVDSSKRIVRAHPGSPVTHGIALTKSKVDEASGYIPSNKEKNDPRFKTALTVDVKPDSIKKNAKAFNWKTSRAGIPPEANTNGLVESKINEAFNQCYIEAQKLYDLAVEKKLKPQLVQVAGYKGDTDNANDKWKELPPHVWHHYVVIVGDTVLDPTAKQFGDDKPTKYSKEQLDANWAEQYVIKPNTLNQIDEALKPSQYRTLIKDWDKSRYADIFSKYPDTDRNAYRIYLPLPASTSEPKSKVAPEVEKHLAAKGYTIKDYTGGLATDGRREMRIGKLLSDAPDVAKQFTNDPARAASKQSQLVVISRHPYDIAGMSTDRGWTSCMNLDGMHADYVPVDIRKGTIVAYLINADDRDIKNPIARIAIKPFVNTADPDEVVLGAENKVYGTASPAFKSAVIKWVNQINKAGALEGVFVLKPGLYSDSANRPKIRIKDKKLAAQMNTFAKNPWAIIDMPDPPESLQLAAIAMGGPTIIKYIKNPTEKAQLTAVKQDSDVIQHIKNPTEKVQLAAVKQYGYVIKYIENPSEDVQMAAVKENVWSIQHIKNPSKDVKDFADRYFENFRKNELVESPINSENKIILSTDPDWYGAEVGDYEATGPVVNIPTNKLVGFEPDDKMSQPKSKANVKKIVAGLKQGAKLPPILVRKYKNGYQVIDGHHRFWAYKLLGVKSIPAQVVPAEDIVMNEQAFTQINEAFNTPYPYKWENEENDYGDWDAVTRLPDGTPLHIMFSYNNDENSVTLSFFRNNTQDVTGEGDAFRIFATVMAALSEYNKKIKPRIIYFTASKDDDDEAGTESRTKLYNRMVAKYASHMGYNATIEENEYGIDYTLVRISNKTK